MLSRDLTQVTFKAGTHNCVVLTGSLIALDYTNAKRPAKLERGAEIALT